MPASLNVISFSLYGSKRLYCEGALRNVELAPIHYPGWICRFYIDDTVPRDYQSELAARGAQIIRVTKPALGPMYGRYWRFWVAADTDVSRFIVRDVDSRLNSRERAAVDEWISSGKTFHVMRDSVHHKTRALAGMWGGIGGKLPDIEALVDGWGRFDEWGQNDQFVSEILFPLMLKDYVCHDGAGYFDDGRPFPAHAPLSGTRYVGEVVDDDRPPVDIWRQSAELENWLVTEKKRSKTLAARIDDLAEDLRVSEADKVSRAAQIDTLTEQLSDTHAKVASRSSQISELADQLDSLKTAATSRQEQINLLVQELKQLLQDNADLKRKVDEKTRDLEAKISAFKQSTSWRITTPLRAARVLIVQWFCAANSSGQSR